MKIGPVYPEIALLNLKQEGLAVGGPYNRVLASGLCFVCVGRCVPDGQSTCVAAEPLLMRPHYRAQSCVLISNVSYDTAKKLAHFS